MLKFFPTIVSAVLAVQAVFAVNITQTIPVAKTLNGSYHGVHIEPLNQDLFLGIPFAEPPVKDLRFANPRSLNITWQGSLPATNYAPRCVGYGSVQQGYQQNEDCLYLNIVRPAGYENESLPLLVWIHGGGFSEGGGSDMRFNLSFIVNNSVSIGKPIMAASVAFRLGPFGFMSGDKVAEEGSSNAGLKDQRLGLHWLKENIAGFGGDPEKITLWGQSSGAASVGRQLFAFNGRNDNLFRAAIMMCGTAIFSGPDRSTEYYQPRFDSLVKATGCEEHANTLACIRQLPYAVLNNILNTTSFNFEWFPIVDGDFTARHGMMKAHPLHNPPTARKLSSPKSTASNINPIALVFLKLTQLTATSVGQIAWPADILSRLVRLYTEDKEYEIPSAVSMGGNVSLGPPYGAFWRRSAAYAGDYVFIAARRLNCQTWASAGIPAYCYRFNAFSNIFRWPLRAGHTAENTFAFANVQGLGEGDTNPLANKPQSYFDLAYFMSSSLASFAHDLNPNGWQGRDAAIESWPAYDLASPKNLVFDANVTSHLEPDTYRAEGIKLINDNNHLQHR
ncbi:related to cholinesterase [Rhynchosporium agropyri]|uniref:Carboxylic ester hydrolase n=1 Tax=Rhynchosporium agropyri TaxID=914238 RepID=A0A1E1KW06_9HELO|nr:related to cholinesterase [Rhynchosporium agropyri]